MDAADHDVSQSRRAADHRARQERPEPEGGRRRLHRREAALRRQRTVEIGVEVRLALADDDHVMRRARHAERVHVDAADRLAEREYGMLAIILRAEQTGFLAGDGDGEISPRKADVVLSFIGDKTTGTNGRATIQVEYPMNVATWLQYAVKVTTSVAGSEGVVEKTYTTGFVEGDDKNGSFLTPAYGVNDCFTPD